ncbi:BRCA1-associated ATM activator 1-like [Oncorhynchus keta]|uniref:BRCA1-associated ATM activator 1-like n=1 Tax=Oncorhynchus keta TaxID=8018 RepID=UPI00227B5CC0|nr:BRCA1-associated ATM activator 1-like [Oncorhynchus keta]
MDSECLVLLPQVCAVLADPRQSLPDDTSLEKLLDWFTGLTKEDISYLFIPSQDRSILGVAYDSERWQVAGQWEDPSVRIGWIHGLSNMMRHTQAFHFLDQAGLTKPLLQLQTDPSLFVASAANHLLARLLTFHQPATTSHTTQGNGLTVPPNKEEVELDVTMETSPGSGCSITMEILKHLESSLESDSHTQVLQGLRLLALTLPELEAPLRGSVIRRVLRSLEGLVREGAVAQPLMDVLLATYRSGPCDSRLFSLMASMLNSQNPLTLLCVPPPHLHPGDLRED